MSAATTRQAAPLRLCEPAETKLTPFDAADVGPQGIFEGYASLFNREDLGRDIVLPGAFRRSLGERGPSGIRMLYQHDPAVPLGAWLRVYEDARGLFVRGKLALGSATARDVQALLRAGAIDGLSIGFRAVKGDRDRRTGIRKLVEIDLWEISIVTFPMLPGARVEASKGLAGQPAAGRHPVGRSVGALVEQIGEAARLLRSR